MKHWSQHLDEHRRLLKKLNNKNMKHYALRLPLELIEAIKKDAKKNQRSTSAQIRYVLKKHLEK